MWAVSVKEGADKSSKGSDAAGTMDIADMKSSDAAADPSIPDSLGGKGFSDIADSLGWQTSSDYGKLVGPRERKRAAKFRWHGLKCPIRLDI